MNDTKWRGVFRVLAEHQASFHIAYADVDPWYEGQQAQLHCVPIQAISERGLLDPGVGDGPLLFKQILWIRVPETHLPDDLRSPGVHHDLQSLRGELEELGKLPLRLEEGFLEIRGYS